MEKPLNRLQVLCLGALLGVVLTTLLYAASDSCLRDQGSLACLATNGDFAKFLHSTWIFR